MNGENTLKNRPLQVCGKKIQHQKESQSDDGGRHESQSCEQSSYTVSLNKNGNK